MKSHKIKVVTGPVRFEYVRLDTSEPPLIEGRPFKYCISVVIDKSNLVEIERITKVVEMLKKDLPLNARGGLIEGKEPDCQYLNAVNKERPAIVDADLNPILDITEIYSGCTGRVSLTAYTYQLSELSGVAFGLNSILKLADGPELLNDLARD